MKTLIIYPRRISIILTAVGTLALVGCAPKYMTRTLKESLQSKNLNLSKYRYVLSEKVVLLREMKVDDRDVAPGHAIKIVRGKRVEEIVFPKGTQGVVVKKSSGPNLFVSFESGSGEDPDPALPFAISDQIADDRYVLKSGWSINYAGKDFQVCVGKSTFSGDIFLTLQSSRCRSSATAALIVDINESKVSLRERRVVPGRKVGE